MNGKAFRCSKGNLSNVSSAASKNCLCDNTPSSEKRFDTVKAINAIKLNESGSGLTAIKINRLNLFCIFKPPRRRISAIDGFSSDA